MVDFRELVRDLNFFPVMGAAAAIALLMVVGVFIDMWQERRSKAVADGLLDRRPDLRYGKLMPHGFCHGCGYGLAELIGHPSWSLTCTNPSCPCDHVAQGRRVKGDA